MGAGRFVLSVALLGIAGGILAADHGLAPPLSMFHCGAVVLGALGSLVASGATAAAATLAAVLLAASALGAWRHAAADPLRPSDRPSVAALVDGDEHEVAGTVLDDPRPRQDRMQMVLGDLVANVDGMAVALADRLLVWMPRGIAVDSGDRLRVRTEIELPEDFDGFAYREYLARQGVGAIGRAREAAVIAEASGPAAALAGLRGALLGGLNGIVPEPEAALGAGIPARRAGIDRAGDQRRVRDGRADPCRRHLRLEHRDRSRAGGGDGAAAGAASRRTLEQRGRGRADRGWLCPAHRCQPIGGARGPHGRVHARCAARRVARTCCVGVGARRARHAARGAIGAVGRRLSAVVAGDGGSDLVRGVGRATAARLAGLDPGADRTHPRGADHDLARHPRQLRTPVHRGSDRERAGRAVRARGHAVQRHRLGHRARRRLGARAPGRRCRHLARRRLRVVGAARHRRPGQRGGVAALRRG